MHPTTPGASRTSRRAFWVLLAALLLLGLAQAPAALAAADFAGGALAGDYPLYVANDHSVNALRFEAGGLAASTDYYVKMRISPTAAVSGGASRGFTWNPTSQQWVQERDAWSSFPTIATDGSGSYVSDAWTYFKFGDTTKPAKGTSSTWYLVVSLQPVTGGSGTTVNSATARAVTLIDMTGDLSWATPAFRVHNGAPTGATQAQRVEADSAGVADVVSLSLCEPNGVAEGYGNAGTGDFDIAVPGGVAVDTKVQSAVWPSLATTLTGSLADVDIQRGGGGDATPPAAPDGFASSIVGTAAHLSWGAVTGASSYTVYQWQDATPVGGATNYTPQHLAVGTTTGTSHDVTGLAAGQTYHFEVRAVDASGNIGPRSRYPVVLTLRTSTTTVAWGGIATLTGALTDGAEAFAAGQRVNLESSTDGATWTAFPDQLSPVTSFTYGASVNPTQKTRYRLVFAGDGVHQEKASDPVTVTPRVQLGTPVAPRSVKKGAKFSVHGSLAPKQLPGSRTVKIKCYAKQSGVWKLKTTVTATNRDYQTASRYSVKLSLPAKGRWKLVAGYAANATYAETLSAPGYVKAR